jgi:hypothetical protein
MEGAKEKEKEDIPGCVSDAGKRKKRNRDGCKTKKKRGLCVVVRISMDQWRQAAKK